LRGGVWAVLVDHGGSFEDSNDGLVCLFPRVDFGFGIDGTETEVPCPQMIHIKRCPRKLCLDILFTLESATILSAHAYPIIPMRRISVDRCDRGMVHHLFRDKSVFLIRTDVLVRLVLQHVSSYIEEQEGRTRRGLKGLATRLTVEAYSLAAKAATYAARSTGSAFVTAIFSKSIYSISSHPRCNKLVHSLKLTGSV
jgi:hypothetical protein